MAALAAAPVLLVLVLMTARGWSAARAGAATAVFTLLVATFGFGFGDAEDDVTVAGGLTGVAAEALFITLTVVAIIGPALGIHHLQRATGATARLREGLARLHPDPRVAGLFIAWFFALFLEGAAGFGTPVALAAPFLVAAGFSPLAAVSAALAGHAAGVSFGAVGTPVLAQSAIAGVPAGELARATAPYHLVLGWILASVVVVTIGRATGRSAPWAWGALAAVLFFVPYGLIAFFVGPELPTLGGGLVGAATFAVVVRSVRGRAPAGEGSRAADAPGSGTAMPVAAAAAPYLVLVAAVLATRLIPPLQDALRDVVWEWERDGGFAGRVQPVYHPALVLTLAFVGGAVAQRASWRDTVAAAVAATRQLGGVVVALVAMVTIARTMTHAGMTDELADTAAGAGAMWPLLAPAVGALGTFVTGSATASNVLFTDLQQTTAEASELEVAPLLGAQGFGAAVGNIVCPHNIVAAAATVGLTGSEGLVLQRTIPTALAYVALGGLLALVMVHWW